MTSFNSLAHCLLVRAAEFLCTRWTVLILREMIFGSSSFNDISRGVPRMSRTLLSKRLKELVAIGLVKKGGPKNTEQQYHLTPAGEAMRSVVFSMADWAQEWLDVEPALKNIDADLLLWNIRRHCKTHRDLPDPFIVHFLLKDQIKKRQNSWLIFDGGQVDLCVIDRDFEADVQVETTAVSLTSIWMGWADFDAELAANNIMIHGPKAYVDLTQHWLGHSRLATIERQKKELRVG